MTDREVSAKFKELAQRRAAAVAAKLAAQEAYIAAGKEIDAATQALDDFLARVDQESSAK